MIRISSKLKNACGPIKMLLFDCDGVLTDGRIILGPQNLDIKCFSTKDGQGINSWRLAGFKCGCITARRSESLERRARELNFDELHQEVTDKKVVLETIKNKYLLQNAEVAYIGDDLNDLCVLNHVGIFFAPADCHNAVRMRADFVLSAAGGYGAVREAIDILLTAKGLMEEVIAKYLR